MKKILVIGLVFCLIGGMVLAGGAGQRRVGDDNVTLRFAWWGSDTRHQLTFAAIEEYQRRNPHVEIEGEPGVFGTFLVRLLTQLNAGNAPDVFGVDFRWVNDLLSQNTDWFVNFNRVQGIVDTSGIDMNFANQWGAVGGHLIGFPLVLNAGVFTYNADALRTAGITIPTEWDWDELISVGERLRRFNPNLSLFYATETVYSDIMKVWLKQRTGNDIIDNNLNIGVTQRDVEDFFVFFRRLVDSGTIPPFEQWAPFHTTHPFACPYFVNQEWLGTFGTISHFPGIQAASSFQLDVARWPLMRNHRNPALITSTAFLSVNNRSPHREESLRFVDWIMNNEDAIRITQGFWGLPAVRRAQEILVAEGLIAPQIPRALEITMPFSGGPESQYNQTVELNALTIEYIQQIGFRRMSPQDAATRFMTDLNALVANFRARR